MPQKEVFPGSGNVTDIFKEDCRGSFNYDYIDKNLTEFRNCSDFPKFGKVTCDAENCTPDCTEVDDFADSCQTGKISGCNSTTTKWASHKYANCVFGQNYTKPDGTKNTTWDQCRLQGAEGFSYKTLAL